MLWAILQAMTDQTLTKAILDRATVIDVRTYAEVEDTGTYPNALHIPLDEFPSRFDELSDLEGPLVLYCRSGNRSGQACQFLESEGFSNLYNGINLDYLNQI